MPKSRSASVADRSKELFAVDAPMDHFVVGDPDVPNDGSQASRADPDDDDDDDDDMPTDSILKAAAPSARHGDRTPEILRMSRPRSGHRSKATSKKRKRDSQRPGQQQLGCQRRAHRNRKTSSSQRYPSRAFHSADLV